MLTVTRAADRAAAGALAAASRFDPAVRDVRCSPGILLFTGPTGDGRFFAAGLPPPGVRP